MLDPAISEFLNERQEAWLKKKINNTLSDEKRLEIEQQAQNEFSLAAWLPSAAKRAGQLSLVSHPSKFSHPSSKITSIIATAPRRADGLLRTGNAEVGLDVFGNAAAMDVYKFLLLILQDGRSVLQHLEDNSESIQAQFTLPTASFSELSKGLLAIKESVGGVGEKTSGLVKQVYFPVGDGYHLLSTLTPSGLMYGLKDRINAMRFSDAAKEVREAKKKGQFHEQSLSEVYGLTAIGFGGTKPQNISVLNSQNGGVSYLLSSMPPELKTESIRRPKRNFFSESLWLGLFKDAFEEFHRLLIADVNNRHLRSKRDWVVRSIFYQVADRLWLLRTLDAGWSDAERFDALPHYQKIWLDQRYKTSREEDLAWFEKVEEELVGWFVRGYKTALDREALSLGDDQFKHIHAVLEQCEGGLQ